MAASKAEVRCVIQDRVRALGADECRRRSAEIVARLEDLPEWQQAQELLVFWPLPYEVDIRAAIVRALANKRRVYGPCVSGSNLVFVRVGAETTWVGAEPVSDDSCDLASLDIEHTVILVPGIAFSARRERLGRGGGHYDRTLAELSGRVRSIGLAFEEQILRCLPLEEHDLKVDLIVTEQRVLR